MLGNVYILAMLNMALFIVFFFMLMNKKGYAYQFKFESKYIVSSIFLILMTLSGLGFGAISINQILQMVLSTYLICRVFYKGNSREYMIVSLLYSLVYILVVCSIYWFILISNVNINIYNILEITLIGTSIIFSMSIHFYNSLERIYKKQKYYLYIGLTTIVNLLIILFINKFTMDIGNIYSMTVENNIDFYYVSDMLMFSTTIKEIFPYILLIVTILLISIFLNTIKIEKERVREEFVNEKLDMEYKHYLIVRDSQEKMRQVYHDMNNHIENIKSLKNCSEDVNKYIKSIEDEVKESKKIYNTGNMLLDIIFSEKSIACNKNNIDFNVAIDFSKCEFIEMIDVSSIFTNLLDNAIEACNKLDEYNSNKYINIKGTFIKGYYVIRCENSKINKVNTKESKIITSKKDKFFHGLGIESIKSSIKRYNGELKIKDMESKFIATIHIPVEQN